VRHLEVAGLAHAGTAAKRSSEQRFTIFALLLLRCGAAAAALFGFLDILRSLHSLQYSALGDLRRLL
jgi:hypothetical protein